MPSSHERSLLEAHVPGKAKQPWAALAGCGASLVDKQLWQASCFGCLLTLVCALVSGIVQDGAGPRPSEHRQPWRQPISACPGELTKNTSSARPAAEGPGC